MIKFEIDGKKYSIQIRDISYYYSFIITFEEAILGRLASLEDFKLNYFNFPAQVNQKFIEYAEKLLKLKAFQ